MQIEIDFDVFKELTNRRKSEEDSYNDVIRRLLQLPDQDMSGDLLNKLESGKPWSSIGLGGEKRGVYFSNIFFPNGTKFRANYKGRTFHAQIEDEIWTDADGTQRKSPSDAASAISGTSVNGWKFWHVKRPNDDDWARMDDLRQ